MAYIRIDLNHPMQDGDSVKFKAPCDCTAVIGIKVYYPVDGNTTSKTFRMCDAHYDNLSGVGHVFRLGAIVEVVLDVTNSVAFIQNAATNKYLETRIEEVFNEALPLSCPYHAVPDTAATYGVGPAIGYILNTIYSNVTARESIDISIGYREAEGSTLTMIFLKGTINNKIASGIAVNRAHMVYEFYHNVSSADKATVNRLGMQSDIDAIKTSFQDGCDTMVSKCTALGTTPSSNSPADISTAMSTIATNKYNAGYNAGYVQGEADATPTVKSKTITLAAGSAHSYSTTFDAGGTVVMAGITSAQLNFETYYTAYSHKQKLTPAVSWSGTKITVMVTPAAYDGTGNNFNAWYAGSITVKYIIEE